MRVEASLIHSGCEEEKTLVEQDTGTHRQHDGAEDPADTYWGNHITSGKKWRDLLSKLHQGKNILCFSLYYFNFPLLTAISYSVLKAWRRFTCPVSQVH